jgi:hypothetical protein
MRAATGRISAGVSLISSPGDLEGAADDPWGLVCRSRSVLTYSV